jgi:hypothetical protein
MTTERHRLQNSVNSEVVLLVQKIEVEHPAQVVVLLMEQWLMLRVSWALAGRSSW